MPYSLDQCRYCWLRSGGKFTPALPNLRPMRCSLEGPIVDPAACNCPSKHVRVCLYDGPDETKGDRCVRVPYRGGDPGIASCFDCNYNDRSVSVD